MRKTLYRSASSSRRGSQITHLYRNAHEKNPFAVLQDDDDGDSTDTDLSVEIPPKSRKSPRKKPKKNVQRAPNKPSVSNDDEDDDNTYLDQQVENNKTSVARAPSVTPKGKPKVSAKTTAKKKKTAVGKNKKGNAKAKDSYNCKWVTQTGKLWNVTDEWRPHQEPKETYTWNCCQGNSRWYFTMFACCTINSRHYAWYPQSYQHES